MTTEISAAVLVDYFSICSSKFVLTFNVDLSLAYSDGPAVHLPVCAFCSISHSIN